MNTTRILHLFSKKLAALLTMFFLQNSAFATENTVVLVTPSGNLTGTLSIPKFPSKRGVVLIVSGSGPTDRDGNSAVLPGSNNSLKMVAQELANAGYASLRYDKRGIGASASAGPREADLRFETYVDDASRWISLLKDDSRFSSVIVLGHSEGSLIGMLASKRGNAKAFISIAGLACRASDEIRRQLSHQMPMALMQESEVIIERLEKGQVTSDISEPLRGLFRNSVQPYLISWFKYVPKDQLAILNIPILIIHGTTDIQVDPLNAEALKKAKPSSTLVYIDGMNHVLKTVSSDQSAQISSYSDPTFDLAPQLVPTIVRFAKALENQ